MAYIMTCKSQDLIRLKTMCSPLESRNHYLARQRREVYLDLLETDLLLKVG